MENSVEESNKRLKEAFKNQDLDMSHIDFSDIEYIISPNFITRGSIYKNSDFDKEKNDSFADELLNDINKN